MNNLVNNTPISPEDRTMALMRNKPQRDYSFSSGASLPVDDSEDYVNLFSKKMRMAQNVGVGSVTPDTEADSGYDGDFGGYIKQLADKFGVSQKFGNANSMYKGGVHQGLDIRTPVGTELISPVEGQVKVGYDPRGYGKYVQITTPDGETVQFSHLSDTSDFVKELMKSTNRSIKKGQVIGKTGGATTDPNRGLSTGAHVDITYKRGDKFINPLGRT